MAIKLNANHLSSKKSFSLTTISLVTLLLSATSYANQTLPPVQSKNSLQFLTINDIHLNNTTNHQMVIDPNHFNKKNDMDRVVYDKLITTVRDNIGQDKLISQPEFVLYIGDAVGHLHDVPVEQREKFVNDNTIGVYKGLLKMFPHTPIINLFGNNDSFPRDYGVYDFQKKSTYDMAMEAGFKNGFLSSGEFCKDGKVYPCIVSQDTKYGYFTLNLRPKLELLGLNSIMFSTEHEVQTGQKEQFAYITKQLKMAKEHGKSVIIAMHIPVGHNVYKGKPFWRAEYQQPFVKLLKEYSAQVKGVIVGHTHMEEFKKLKTPTGYLGEYFSAGFSTSHGNSPAVKVFDLSKYNHKWAISNFTTYQIHQAKGEPIKISKYYDFTSTYCKHPNKVHNINNCLADLSYKDIAPRYTVNNPNHPTAKVKDPSAFVIK